MRPRQAEKVLVWLPNPVGDVVMATPALRAVREHFAGARISHVGRAPALAVLSGTDLADEMIPDRSSQFPRLANSLRLIRRLRKGGHELGILLPNSFRSAAIARLGGIGSLVGYARGGRGWMLDVSVRPQADASGRRTPMPTIDQYRLLVDAIGVECPSRRMELPIDPQGRRQAASLLADAGADDGRPIVMLNPGGAFGPSKRWPAGRFAAVADSLIERRRAQIVINAAPSERQTAGQVAAGMRRKPLINLAHVDNSITLVKGLLRRCSLLITNDTGARHIAAAFGVPVVSVFGSTDPVWAQIDYERERIVRVDVPCSPCQKKRCPQPPGPTFHQCMAAITPEMVLSAAEELLDAGQTGQWAQEATARQREQTTPPDRALLKRHGLDTIGRVFAYSGGEDFDKAGLAGRRRTRLELADGRGRTHVLYLKRYARERFWPRLRRFLETGRREGPALTEWRNIMIAEAAGVATMKAVACGQERDGRRGRCLRGYIIVTEVPGDALERCGQAFIARCADSPEKLAEFTRSLARLVRRLHEAGCVHRDLYASHVFLDEAAGPGALFLIDLARMFSPRWRKFRWRVKDLGQLYYSMPDDWVGEHWPEFLREYLGTSDDGTMRKWRRAVRRKADRIRRREKGVRSLFVWPRPCGPLKNRRQDTQNRQKGS